MSLAVGMIEMSPATGAQQAVAVEARAGWTADF